jgi:IclR helix-turn-helix domain
LEPAHSGVCRHYQAEPSSNTRGKSGEFVLEAFRVKHALTAAQPRDAAGEERPCHTVAMAARPTRYHLIDVWISLTRGLHRAADPAMQEYSGAHTADLLICSAVYLGTTAGRPMTAAKLAAYVGIPRPTVIRHLRELERRRLVEHIDGLWRTAPNLMQQRKQYDFSELTKLIAAVQRRLASK